MADEFTRLRGPERRAALRSFHRWVAHYENLHGSPLSADDRQKSLNLSYIGVSQMWLGFSLPFWLIAAVFWALHDSAWQVVIAVVSTVIVVALMVPLAIRWRQARGYWPGKVDPWERDPTERKSLVRKLLWW